MGILPVLLIGLVRLPRAVTSKVETFAYLLDYCRLIVNYGLD